MMLKLVEVGEVLGNNVTCKEMIFSEESKRMDVEIDRGSRRTSW
jgi:hypothetical protein